MQELGGVLVIEGEQHNYSPTEICRIAESDSYIVNYLHATPGHKDNYVYITLKVNRKEIQPLKAAFERFGYDIYFVYSDVDTQDIIKERFESLMHYLNV